MVVASTELKLECPTCSEPLSLQDVAWVKEVIRLSSPWSFTFMNPDGWRVLSCTHGLEVMVDRTESADRLWFHLEGRPVLIGHAARRGGAGKGEVENMTGPPSKEKLIGMLDDFANHAEDLRTTPYDAAEQEVFDDELKSSIKRYFGKDESRVISRRLAAPIRIYERSDDTLQLDRIDCLRRVQNRIQVLKARIERGEYVPPSDISQTGQVQARTHRRRELGFTTPTRDQL